MAQAIGVTLHLTDAAFDLLSDMAARIRKQPEYCLMQAMKALSQSLGVARETPNLDASEELLASIEQAASERGGKTE